MPMHSRVILPLLLPNRLHLILIRGGGQEILRMIISVCLGHMFMIWVMMLLGVRTLRTLHIFHRIRMRDIWG